MDRWVQQEAEIVSRGFPTTTDPNAITTAVNIPSNFAIGVGGQPLATSNNVAFGSRALDRMERGDGNIAVGAYAGAQAIEQQRNTLLGAWTEADGYTDAIVLGCRAKAKPCRRCDGKNKLIVLGEIAICQACLQETLVPTQRYQCYACLQSYIGGAEGIAMPDETKHGKTVHMGICNACVRDHVIAAHAKNESRLHGMKSTEERLEARLALVEAKLAGM